MKTKLLILFISFALGLSANASDKNTDKQLKEIEVIVDAVGDKVTKKIIVNGKELNAQEIKEFEASHDMQDLHRDHDKSDGKIHKIIVIDADDPNNHGSDKNIKIIKKHVTDSKHMKWVTNGNDENIEVFIEKDGNKTTEKITVNGQELTPDEIKAFKKSGKMKVIHMDEDMKSQNGNKMIFIKSDSDSADADVDVEVIMDIIHESSDANAHPQVWYSKDGKNVKIIKKEFLLDDDHASLGIMANVEDDGWHLSQVIEGSGAAVAGILKGDVVIKIADTHLVKSKVKKSKEPNKVPKFKEGEHVKVIAIRDGKTKSFDVVANKLDKSKVSSSDGSDKHFEWIEKLHDGSNLISENVKVMVFNGVEGNYKLNTDDIHMLFPKDLGDMNVFISDGKSTSTLLGKNHELTSLSDELGKYFNTKGGVLVLHVDDSNAFALQDGDVIKSIDGKDVNSPKDVIKQLINAKKQKDIKLKIVRHKRNKTLKYNK